jgi:hypothetical protein
MLAMQAGACTYSMYNGMYYKALYWVGAFVLTLAVVKGLNK